METVNLGGQTYDTFLTNPEAVCDRASARSQEETSNMPANPDQLQTEETFEDIKMYFTKDEWVELQDWEKEVYKSLKEHYDIIISSGYSIPKPDFMCEVEETHQVSYCVSSHCSLDKSPIEPETNTVSKLIESPFSGPSNIHHMNESTIIEKSGGVEQNENIHLCTVQEFQKRSATQSKECSSPSGLYATTPLLHLESGSERATLRSPAPMPRRSSRHRSMLGPTHVEAGRRHRHGSSRHRHRSRHGVDLMLGEVLKGIMNCLDSLEARYQEPPKTLPSVAASSPGPSSSAPTSPPQAPMELTTSASVSAPLVQVPDSSGMGPSSKPPTSRRVSKTPDAGQAGRSCTLPRRVIPPHTISVEVGSEEVWCKAEEGLNPGEVSEAFYTSSSMDLEQGVKSDLPTQDASFQALIEKMAGVLALELSSASKTDQSRFMQVLQGQLVRSRLQVPLHDTVLTMLRDICRNPTSVLPAHRQVDRQYLVPDDKGPPLSSHPSAESTVAVAANDQARTQRVFSSAPPERDARRWDALGKKVYSSASLGIRISSFLAHMSQYNHDLWDEVTNLSELVPADKRKDVLHLAKDGIEVSRALMQGAYDVCDTAARGVATGVSIRRQAWLKGSGFLPKVQQQIADLPFTGGLLFGDKTESALQHLKEAKSTVRSLAPLCQAPRPRPPFCPQGEAKRPFSQGQKSAGPSPSKRRQFTR
ncbi:uncharacterized protein LOC135355649 [Latimeria chalumnae]|uniref:uncharacterized protein LOC135355649 n=1 Tax=Latimeria chalumnae TaxID=7897 RepID=UPI00313E28FC